MSTNTTIERFEASILKVHKAREALSVAEREHDGLRDALARSSPEPGAEQEGPSSGGSTGTQRKRRSPRGFPAIAKLRRGEVLAYFLRQGNTHIADAAKAFGAGHQSVYNHVAILMKEGRLRRVGRSRSGVYGPIPSPVVAPSPGSVVASRPRDPEGQQPVALVGSPARGLLPIRRETVVVSAPAQATPGEAAAASAASAPASGGFATFADAMKGGLLLPKPKPASPVGFTAHRSLPPRVVAKLMTLTLQERVLRSIEHFSQRRTLILEAWVRGWARTGDEFVGESEEAIREAADRLIREGVLHTSPARPSGTTVAVVKAHQTYRRLSSKLAEAGLH